MTRHNEKLLIITANSRFAEAIAAQIGSAYEQIGWDRLADSQEDALYITLPETPEELEAAEKWRTNTGRTCLLILPSHLSETNSAALKLTRPFRRQSLLQRVENLRLQNSEIHWPNQIRFIPATGKLLQGDRRAELTERENALLHYLATEKQEVPREVLLKQVWRYQADIETNTLESTLYRLRTKMAEICGHHVEIHHGEDGYQLKISD